MKAALYLRVSTDEQAREGFSLSAQERSLRQMCVDKDWGVHDVYIDDGYSAKDTKRPALQRMLAEARDRQFNILLFYKYDRLSRSVKDVYTLWEELSKYDVEIVSYTEPIDTRNPMGKAMMGNMSVFAEWERDTIRQRVRFGMEQKAREGKRPGAPKPFGYDSDGNQIPREVEMIKELRRMYMNGSGFYTISQTMNRNGLFHRGVPWSQQYVKYCLDNPWYAGLLRWGVDGKGEIILTESDHEPIWTKEEYEIHIRRMKMRSGKNFTKTFNYWFTGVLRCGRCGESMIGRRQVAKRKTKETYEKFFYRCSARNSGMGCKMPALTQDLIEHLIFTYIEKYQTEMENVKRLSTKLATEEKKKDQSRKKLEQQYNQVRERIKKWQVMCVNGLITEEELRDYLKEERTEEERLKRKIGDLTNENVNVPNELFMIPDLWPNLDDQEKHYMITSIFKTIVIDSPNDIRTNPGQFRDAEIKDIEYL